MATAAAVRMRDHAPAFDLVQGADLCLLGGFSLITAEGSSTLPLAAQKLLGFLALRDQSARRGFVAGSLWLDSSEERSSANLRSTLWRLRRSVGDVVQASDTHLGLAPWVSVDVRAMISVAHSLLYPSTEAQPEPIDERLLLADLLPDWYDDWVLIERERLRQLRLHALEAMVESLLDRGLFGRAMETAQAALRCEPLRESVHRLLIRIHLAEGNRMEAAGQFEAYEQMLWSEMGISPAPEIRTLVAPYLTRR